jgi:protoheme IX farnesyltransferase
LRSSSPRGFAATLPSDTRLGFWMLAVIERRGFPLREYLLLTKPGILLGNLVAFAGGFFLASQGHPDIVVLIATGLGVALVMASGCVCNNLVDRDIDAKMARTRRRALVTGVISPNAAALAAAVLGATGFALLAVSAGALVVGVVLAGFLVYALLYSLVWKRSSVHGTLLGSLAGATAPVAGYCAASGRFDGAALLLLVIFCLWQMPHAYAIAISRLHDYRAAAVPVLPALRGIAKTKRQIVVYILAFLAAVFALPLLHYVGWAYVFVMAVVGAGWLRVAVAGRPVADDRAWARGVFGFSLLVVVVLSAMLALDTQAPPPAVSLDGSARG